MPWRRFLLANAAGALAWSVTMSLLGYFFGHSWEILHKVLGRGGMILLGSIVLLAGLPYVLRRLHRLTPGLWATLARSQIYLGMVAALLEVVCIALLVQLAQGRQATRFDRAVAGWIASLKPNAFADRLAQIGSAVGTLPAVALLTLLVVAWLRYRDRSWRECAASFWALIASEAVGLLAVALLRVRHSEPTPALVWPFGFAG